MNLNIEKELKILVTKEQFFTLFDNYNDLKFHTQLNVYYDTLDSSIRNIKGAMRIRTIENTHFFTLKLISDIGLKEFECTVLNNSIHSLSQDDIQELLTSYNIKGPFIEIGRLETKRAMFINKSAELCFDINTYNGISDYEIEYEYKRDHDGICAFNNILKMVNLEYKENCSSKIARALTK